MSSLRCPLTICPSKKQKEPSGRVASPLTALVTVQLCRQQSSCTPLVVAQCPAAAERPAAERLAGAGFLLIVLIHSRHQLAGLFARAAIAEGAPIDEDGILPVVAVILDSCARCRQLGILASAGYDGRAGAA